MEETIRRLAAIDVGSNAVRLVIGRIYNDDKGRYLKREASYRVPLRLGDDVFGTGIISSAKVDQMVVVFQAFQNLLTFFAPLAIRACATSAMREAGNGPLVAETLLKRTGISLETVSGKYEAQLLFANQLEENDFDRTKAYLFIDVGGGSMELTLMTQGKVVASDSFRVGTVRTLQGKVTDIELERMRQWIAQLPKVSGEVMAIGTGGNIGKIYDLSSHESDDHRISRKSIKDVLTRLESFSFEDRIRKIGLKPDRADVIVPAGRIYNQVMKLADIKDMVVPKVGVSDGILQEMFLQVQP